MKFLKRSARPNPKVSLILLDWSVRESFHLLHYLGRQDVPRDDFEVLVIEYYSRVSDAIRRFEDQVDTWLLLEMPEDCYYHKHVMYNAGIVLARGEICVICDSDAMVKPGFIRAIVEGRAPTIYGDGEQTRDFTYVSNVVDGVLRACQAPKAAGSVINVATGGRISLNELYAALQRLTNTSIPVQYAE